MYAKIQSIAYALPSTQLSNDAIKMEFPEWNMDIVEERAGVVNRYIVDEGQTAFDLALSCCEKLLNETPSIKAQVDALFFCTQCPDHIMPPNGCLLHERLGLSRDVFVMDFNLACSGFVYGLSLAESFIQSGKAQNILLVTADTYSRLISAQDRSARTLFGDGAAVTWLQASENREGILASKCGTDGNGADKFIVPAGGQRMPLSEETAVVNVDSSGNARTLAHIHMDGMAILGFVNSLVGRHVKLFLKEQGLTIQDDIDLVVFHQASKLALDALQRQLNIPQEKLFTNLADVGNTVSASIPIAIKDAQDQNKIRSGSLVLLCGFGVGFSWGSALVQF